MKRLFPAGAFAPGPLVFLSPALVSIAVACSSSGTGSGDSAAGDSNGFNDPPFDVPACVTADGAIDPSALGLTDSVGNATATVTGTGCARSFTVDSTASRMDNLPAGPRALAETGLPSVQTTSPLFDALYQLALDDAKEASVDGIQDGAFNNGNTIPCGDGGCFETGRKWTYVWTRDTSYATNLGLGWVDPIRAKNSLEFKLSKRRDGSDLEIVQDTGSGGSYPISTDRAVWGLGAGEILQHLTGATRTAFRDEALEAAKNTIEQDRALIFDSSDGLYRGETSFLDWREQTYPGWESTDVVNIGDGKALSTNVAHLALLDFAANLATETGDAATAKTMSDRATQLRSAIAAKFWLPEDSQLSSFVTTALDQAPARRFDLLGTALAVLNDAIPASQQAAAIASYPTLPKGPPVIFPEQQLTAIYHNRAIWPFVTAYWVKAAKKVGNDKAFEQGIASLVRGAALNLSNMENMEVVSGAPHVDDGDFSGPVVNSQRQIWSVAGYIGMVNNALFGITPTKGGVAVQPYFTRGLRAMFPNATKIAINDVPIRGHKISVTINLPVDASPSDGGAYVINAIHFNSVALDATGFIDDVRLKDRNLVEVDLGLPTAPTASLRQITDTSDYRSIFGPKTPAVAGLSLDGNGHVVVSASLVEAPSDVTWSVYRDGVRVANALDASATTWTDTDTNGDATPSHCYTVETRFTTGGNVSQHASPACFWGSDPSTRIATLGVASPDVSLIGGQLAGDHTMNWGDPGNQITAQFTASHDGQHLVQARYANGAGPINTGITCGVKHVQVVDASTGDIAGDGYMLMPQRGDWSDFGDSSFVSANLKAGTQYNVVLSNDDRSTNMSSFAHFEAYTGGMGGSNGQFLRVDIQSIKLLSLGQ